MAYVLKGRFVLLISGNRQKAPFQSLQCAASKGRAVAA